jgi:hypothetical protein
LKTAPIKFYWDKSSKEAQEFFHLPGKFWFWTGHGLIAGSAAVLKDEKHLYAYGAVESAAHEVYLLRWKLDEAYTGNMVNPEWWISGKC